MYAVECVVLLAAVYATPLQAAAVNVGADLENSFPKY